MKYPLWLVVSIVLISLGGAMLGRVLTRWVRHKLTRAQLLAGLVTGIAAVGIGVTIRLSRTGHPNADWVRLGFVLVLTAGILLESRERSRLTA